MRLFNLFLMQINHMAAIRGIWACRHGQEELLNFKQSIRVGKKGDLRDFEGSMIVGAYELLVHFRRC